jgi:hypothetical protein
MAAFEDSLRTVWRPRTEARNDARLVWFWHHTHGTGPAYQAVSITAFRDWTALGDHFRRLGDDPELRAWTRDVSADRRDVVSKVLVPAPWSPLQEVDFATPPAAPSAEPVLHLHDTGWPFPGKLDDYVGALGRIFYPQVKQSAMISIEACWTVAAGRFHEVVLLQRIHDWSRFSNLLTKGEMPSRPGQWMSEGLKYRDRWESKLLRTATWSPTHS